MNQNEEMVLLTGKGVMLLTFSAWKEDNTRQTNFFKLEVCKKLALNGYGKSAIQIKQKVEGMNAKELTEWIDRIWGVYIGGAEVFEILDSLGNL